MSGTRFPFSIHWRRLPITALLLVTAISIAAEVAGLIGNSPTVTAVASAALLIFGLPHGTFDLALLRQASGGKVDGRPRAFAILLYLAFAAGMYFVWRIDPLLALAAFLLMAWVHFAEDWDDCGSRFLSYGISAAILSAPALLHRDLLGGLFVSLTADPDAVGLAYILHWIAPVALVLAVAGGTMLWRAGRRTQAISAGCALSALVLLPPVLGFALFFCLVHSPMQFQAHADALGLRGVRQWGRIVIPLSFGGLGVAVVVFMLHEAPSLAAGLFATSFMTLSILTVPHMMVPWIMRRASRLTHLELA